MILNFFHVTGFRSLVPQAIHREQFIIDRESQDAQVAQVDIYEAVGMCEAFQRSNGYDVLLTSEFMWIAFLSSLAALS
jgi:hypothetical protein